MSRLRRRMLMLMGGLTLNAYIQSTLQPVLWYDGTLTNDATPKMKNLGSAGSALDGTITAVTIDANGMNFDGSTSKIVIPDNAAIQALATYTILTVCKATGAGENNAGTILHLGADAAMGFRRTNVVNQWTMGFDTNTTDALSTTEVSFAPDNVLLAFIGTFDNAGDRKARIYKGQAATVTESTYVGGAQTAATGTRVAPVGATVGNFSDVRTWAGSMKQVLVCNRVLTSAEMLQFTKLAGV